MARFAVGDVHGCAKTLKKLIEEGIKLTKEDRLYFLGDLVNKGPDSKGVLDYIFQLQNNNYSIFCLRGNHDQMLLDAFYGKYADYWFSEHAEPKTLKSFGVDSVEDIPVKYFDFIKEMPFFQELDNCFLVHAGFNFTLSSPFLDFKAMLHSRKFELKSEMLGGKILIHGHVPTEISAIKTMAKSTSKEINLDGGCVYYLNDGLGYLTALNLDTFELYAQENIDKPYPIDIKK